MELHRGIGLCGMSGAIVLVSSFVMNPAPPAGSSVEQLRTFAIQHHDAIVFGGWLQATGSLLLVLFAIGVVHLAGAANRFWGWLTFLAGGTILTVSLVEITFYLAAAQAVETGDITSGLVSNALIKAVQHIFLVAPALLIPLGVVLLGSTILPSPLAYLALVIGCTLQVMGLIGLFGALQPVIDVLLIVQALWFVSAGLALVVRSPSRSSPQAAAAWSSVDAPLRIDH